MRLTLLTFIALALLAAGAFGSSAFNYAVLQPRNVIANIVSDNGTAYLSISPQDVDYQCMVGYSAGGVVDVTWDAGTNCNGGGGSGINPDSTYYYHDVLKITNKGTKALTHLWLNMSTDTAITIQYATTAGSMQTTGTYAQNVDITSIAVGSSVYIGYKIDASTKDTSYNSGAGTIVRTMSVEARSSA